MVAHDIFLMVNAGVLMAVLKAEGWYHDGKQRRNNRHHAGGGRSIGFPKRIKGFLSRMIIVQTICKLFLP